MKNIYLVCLALIVFSGSFFAHSQNATNIKFVPERPLFFTPKSHDPNFLKSAKISEKSFYQRKSEWKHIIDTTWGPGAPLTEKLELFNNLAKGIHDYSDYLHFQRLDYDSLCISYRNKIDESTSCGAFSAIISHFLYEFEDAHTFAFDTAVVFSALNPGTPILLVGMGNSIEHFGAVTTILPDSTTLVLRVAPNHPLNLEPGDIILGYEGVPWKRLAKELFDANLPTIGLLGGCKTAAAYFSLIGAGLNWHLFNTMDILKYSTGDTLHLSVLPLLTSNFPPMMNNEQMPIPNIPFPVISSYLHFDENDPSSIDKFNSLTYGILENTNIGYIYIAAEYPYFATDGLLYSALTALKNADALIIDMRLNHGGQDYFVKSFELLFNESQSTVEHVTRCNENTFEFCSGGNQNDLKIISNKPDFYDKPIAVLLGPNAFSYGDITPQRLRYHPMVRFFGTSSNASFGWHNTMIVPGWRIEYSIADLHRVSEPNVYLNKKEFPIDYPVWFNKDDVANGKDPIVEKALNWIKNLTFGNSVRIKSGAYIPGNDTVKVQARIVNPNGHQVSAKLIFEDLDGSMTDSTVMFKSDLTEDSVWLGKWKTPESSEKTYWISLKVNDLTDGTSFCTKHATRITTVPLLIDEIKLNSSANSKYTFQPYLKNAAKVAAIPDITIDITSNDHWITSINPSYISCSDLLQEQIKRTQAFSVSYDAATFPGYFDLKFTISSSGWPYWTDSTKLITALKPEQLLEKTNLLDQNYPNPFNSGTTIPWQLAHSSKATLKVFDLLGREVATLVDEQRTQGKYETRFNAATLPKGVYFYRLKARDVSQTRKMILVK